MISKNNFGSHGYKTALLITGIFLSWSNEASTSPYASSVSEYENIQFNACYSEPSLAIETHSKDWIGTADDTSSKKENLDLRKIITIINKNHQKIISLQSKERHEKSLDLAEESVDLINSSNIFNLNFLKRFKEPRPGERRINAVKVDNISAGQYASVLIASLGYESSVKLGLSKLQQRYWLELSLKYSRWIHENRGCFDELIFNLKSPSDYSHTSGSKVKFTSRICPLVNNVEAVVSKNLFLLDYEEGDFKNAMSTGTLALTNFTLSDRELGGRGLNAFSLNNNTLSRLNILIRLADISERNNKFCISSKSYDRSVKLGKKIKIKAEILDSWQAGFNRASKFIDTKEDTWSSQYGILNKKEGSSYVPIYQVPPVYPRRALEREIEGCVMMQFTVKKDGTTKDPKVLWSVPSEIFDRSAMNSALRYRYMPQMEEGQPIEVSNVKTVLVFKIESPGKGMNYLPQGCD